jgi:hypothetical protein
MEEDEEAVLCRVESGRRAKKMSHVGKKSGRRQRGEEGVTPSHVLGDPFNNNGVSLNQIAHVK